MCGIAGFLESPDRHRDQIDRISEAMIEALIHRGPDDGGTWSDPAIAVALGNRRLSILDLSPLGHQPMASHDGRYVSVFNGEIYNFRGLRDELCRLGHSFRGGSDTEVLVAAVGEWGMGGALERTNGMFALSVWDRRERLLHLARDRMGEKPLYYGWSGTTFLFGSELKALRAHPAFGSPIDRRALSLYFRFKYVPEPWSIYRGIAKLPPASFVTIRPDEVGGMPDPIRYWNAAELAMAGAATPFDGGPDDAVDALSHLLEDSVRLRMLSDVPLGALLSGGLDSTTIVALMQSMSDRPVRTFTIGFHQDAFDESADARTVAAHLGTEHTELIVSPTEAMDVIPRLPSIYDEPFADSSQIPTLLVSELARRSVTVALSGDGGDELFGGYNRYAWVPGLARSFSRAPRPLRRTTAAALSTFTPARWEALLAALDPVLPRRLKHRLPGDKLQKLVEGLRAEGPADMYMRVVSHWDPSRLVIGGVEPPSLPTRASDWPALGDVAAQLMFVDALTYLPGDILAKVDRAAMAASLEVRVPFLDHRVVEFAWSLPTGLKLRDGRGKLPIRALAERFVPREVIERPKMGFGVPIGSWLRGPLRDWAHELLDPEVLVRDGYIDPTPVREAWAEHLSGRRNRQYQLWDVLMFQAWLRTTQERSALPVAGR